jgi:hypothetical protein
MCERREVVLDRRRSKRKSFILRHRDHPYGAPPIFGENSPSIVAIFSRTHSLPGQQNKITAGDINRDVSDMKADISPKPCSPARLKYANKIKTVAISKRHRANKLSSCK